MARPTLTPVHRTYGQALLELAKENDVLDTVAQQVDDLIALLEKDDSLLVLLGTPTLSREDRETLLNNVFANQIDTILLRFILVVNRKDRISELLGIFHGFTVGYDVLLGRVDATLTVAKELNSKEVATLAKNIGSAMNKQVNLDVQVDPSLLGGMTLRVGDTLVDGSVRTKIQNLQSLLAEQARQYARTAVSQA